MDKFNISFDDLFNATYEDEPVEESATPCDPYIRDLNGSALMTTYLVVFVLSMLGNALVVYVVHYMGKRRTSTDIYLMHLALADLLFCLTLPFWAVYVRSGWIFGDVPCKLLTGLQEASIYGGVFLLACISVDRYLAIVKATQLLSSRRRRVGLVCGVVWLAAGVLSLPVALQKEVMVVVEEVMVDVAGHLTCSENLTGESRDRWRTGVRVVRHALGFFLPLAVMVFCYGNTVGTLLRTRNAQKQRALRVILAVVLAFVLCWLPHNVTVLIDTLLRGGSLGPESCDIQNRVDAVLHATQVMAYTHCAVNPVLYAFISQKFRNQLLAALCKHGLISSRLLAAYTDGSVGSTGSIRSRSRNTSVVFNQWSGDHQWSLREVPGGPQVNDGKLVN